MAVFDKLTKSNRAANWRALHVGLRIIALHLVLMVVRVDRGSRNVIVVVLTAKPRNSMT